MSGSEVVGPKIVALGEVLWDVFPDGERFGGAPANFACHAALGGARVALAGAVGDDPRGKEAFRILRRYGIDTAAVQTADRPTGAVGVTLDAAGRPTFAIHEDSAWDRLAWSDALEAHLAAADAVCFGTLGQRESPSRGTIRRALDAATGAVRLLDVNLRPPFCDAAVVRESVRRAGIVKLSDEELPAVCAACGLDAADPPHVLLGRLRESAALDLVVMTRGADGAMLATPQGLVEHPGIATAVRDTVGAGDAFAAAFLLGLLRGDSHATCLHDACVVAAQACSHAGAVPEPPAGADDHA